MSRLLLALLAISLLGFQARQAQPQEHRNDEQRWKVKVPADWEVQKGADESQTLLVAPQEGELDIFRENVAVLVRRQEAKVSLKEAREATKREMEAAGAKLIDSDDKATLAGRDAHRFVWLLELGGFNLGLTQMVTVEADRVYLLTFSVEVGHQHRYANVATAIGNSFEILPHPTTQPSP